MYRGPEGRQLRARRLQPVRDQEHDDRRGRLRHDRRRPLADWIRLYRNQGMRERYHHEILGYNFRMTDIAAAIGLVQLDKLERNTARRQASPRRYDAAFARPAGPDADHARRAGRTSSTSTRSASARQRDAIVADMEDAGVIGGIYYPIPCHRQAVHPGARDRRGPAGHRRRGGRTLPCRCSPA